MTQQAIRNLSAQRQLRSKVPQSVPKRLPAWRFPVAIERDYNSYLRAFVNTFFKHIRSSFSPDRLRRLKENAEAIHRTDEYVEDIEGLVQSAKVSLGADGFTIEQVGRRVEQFAVMAGNFNKKQWQKVLRAGFGVDLLQNEPWLAVEINRFVKENTALITKLEQEMITDIERNILQAARQGLSNKEIAEIIAKRNGVYGSRADLIARDQMNKYNGRLMQNRQMQTGVERYVWRSSDDERVRPLHSEYDNKVFDWDNPPSDGHPGMAIQCRCYAEPVLEDVYKKLENLSGTGQA